MRFGYKEVLGNTIHAYVEDRPEISYAVTELSKFSEKPSEFHHKSTNSFTRYLWRGPMNGIILWGKEPSKEIPTGSTEPLVDN